MNLSEEKQIIDAIEYSLRNFDLGDIKALRDVKADVDFTIAGFILCSCFIEHICTFLFGDQDVGYPQFQGFVRDYLGSSYDPKKLRFDLRNCLVHHYTVGDCYGLTRRNAGLHLKPDPNKSEMIVLNLETFIEDLENGFNKYIVDLRNNKDGLWGKAITAFNKEHQGSDKKMRKRGIMGYARY